MNRSILAAALAAGVLLASACGSTTPDWNNADALSSHSIEVLLDGSARPVEIEYHIAPELVPAHVMASMETLHPGGEVVAAEKEFIGGDLFWEISKEIDGREVEAMFRQTGELHSEELEIPASEVLESLQAAVRFHLGGTVTKWEEIRDEDRELVEYHVKVISAGQNYKLTLSTGGEVLGVVREIPAEIEVPLP